MRNPSHALARLLFEAVNGHRHYLAWIGVLFLLSLLGLNAYAKQLVHGLVTTGMTDQVSWGLYIANFTFLVGMAAAAVMLVIPVYVYRRHELHDLVIELRSLTLGVGSFAFKFDHLQELTGKLAERVIANRNEAAA